MRIYKNIFMNNLKQAIESSGKSKNAIAAAAGVTESMISDYLKGRFNPRPNTVMKLAKALDVEAVWLSGEIEGSPIVKLSSIPKYVDRKVMVLLLDQFATNLTQILKISEAFIDDYVVLLLSVSRLNAEGLKKLISYSKDINKIPEYNFDIVDQENQSQE